MSGERTQVLRLESLIVGLDPAPEATPTIRALTG
jgi:hypothetical protein